MAFRKVGSFWETKKKTGYTGKLDEDVAEGVKLFLGENKKKTKDSQPDFQLFVIEEDKEEEPSF